MEKTEIIDLDETQAREVYPIPVLRMSYWEFTMESCLLTGELEKKQ